ncbi:Nuclear hormone receptor family member nhr-8 [Caenorhabditis elegans]|uniref:Isoform b of Nuclear hormone receptor family member nhr-8 n=1 Tax=Caenorhabditis elegans TaxID=6239 RepID=Q9XYB7-2|nr:Nuclear hormone receptor family member nhr-8 [Caenorhabditis elegans]CCD63762.1 Nuclear hormone receptor family member nhr-8 [Caenorhabditis elegans]|eukprot:NP_001023169.1 Nuclear hormone receptor family member nhr-8 [Caenorhabditis elegans]
MPSSSPSMDESRRSAVPPKEPAGRICTVCSDRANGYNFGVLTCESCKAFFRRNASKHKEIKCPFSDSCQITSASRKFCQACRLNKCFAVGMNSEWLNDLKPKSSIVSGKFKRKKPDMKNNLKVEVDDTEEDLENDDEEQISVPKALLEKLINKANEKSKDRCTCKCQCGFYPITQRLTAYEPKDTTANSPQDISFSHHLHHSDSFYSSSTSTLSPMSVISCAPSSHDSSGYNTSQLVTQSPTNYTVSPASIPSSITELSPQMPSQYPPMLSPFQFGVMAQMAAPANFLNFPPMPERTWTPIQAVSTVPVTETLPPNLLEQIHSKIDKYIGVLNEDEITLLEELHVQNEPLNAPLIQWHNPKSIDGVFRIIEEALRRIVNMACQLSLFRELHVDDRKNLLKSGFGELLIVRGLMAYDKSDNSWNHSFGVRGKMEVKVEVLKNPKLEEHYKAHMNLLSTFGEDVRNNEHLMLIFNAAVIFHPHVSNLRDSKRVHSTQAKYFQMLLKLLTFEYGKSRADIAYSNLLNQVVELHRVNRTLLRVFYGLDIAQLDPLIRELCSFE